MTLVRTLEEYGIGRPSTYAPILGTLQERNYVLREGAIALVVAVIFVFLRSLRATIIPAVAVPLSLVGTFGVMWLLRLQLEQPHADGADHRHRLRGG